MPLLNLAIIFLNIVLLADFTIGKRSGVLAAMKDTATTLRAAAGVGNTDLRKVTSSRIGTQSYPLSALLYSFIRSVLKSDVKLPTGNTHDKSGQGGGSCSSLSSSFGGIKTPFSFMPDEYCDEFSVSIVSFGS